MKAHFPVPNRCYSANVVRVEALGGQLLQLRPIKSSLVCAQADSSGRKSPGARAPQWRRKYVTIWEVNSTQPRTRPIALTPPSLSASARSLLATKTQNKNSHRYFKLFNHAEIVPRTTRDSYDSFVEPAREHLG